MTMAKNSRTMMSLRSLILLVLAPILVFGSDVKQQGIDFLKENALKPDVITLPSGLQYKVLEKGTGKFHPGPSSPCSCHYEGRLIEGKVFDSSYKRGEPTSFAPNQVIKGWTEAMQLMVEGDKWEMYIPSELAYGSSGAGADIPGDATLIFIMELKEINGEKVPALTCNAADGEGCSDKEKAYLEKMKTKSADDQKKQLDRLNNMVGEKMTEDLILWMKARLHILNQLIKVGGEEKDL